MAGPFWQSKCATSLRRLLHPSITGDTVLVNQTTVVWATHVKALTERGTRLITQTLASGKYEKQAPCFHDFFLDLTRLENNTNCWFHFLIDINAILSFHLQQWLSDVFSQSLWFAARGMNARPVETALECFCVLLKKNNITQGMKKILKISD